MKKYSRVFLILLVVVLVLSGFGLSVILRQPKNGRVGRATQSLGQKRNKNDSLGAVSLNDGSVIKVGDTVDIVAPTYYEVTNYIEGTVTNMYPETGRMLIWLTMGVVALNYRYVVDVQASKNIIQYDETEMETLADMIRAVVTLDDDGKETLHFMRNLDKKDWVWNYRELEIGDMVAYQKRQFYNILFDEENGPDDIVAFYHEHRKKYAGLTDI